MTNLNRRVAHRRDAGFTLIELLVVLVLLGIFGTMVSITLIRSMQIERRTSNRAVSQTSMTDAMDVITKDVRAASPVVSRSATSLTVEDYHQGSRFRYTWTYDSAAGTLAETTSKYATATASTPTTTVSRTLVAHVTNSAAQPVFSYYHRDGSAVASTEGTAAVARVDLVLQVTPAEGQPITAQTTIFLRNYVQN